MPPTDSDARVPSAPTSTLPLYPMSINQNIVLGWFLNVLDTAAWRTAPDSWVVTVCVRFGSRRLRFYGRPTDPDAKVRSSVDAFEVDGSSGRYEIYVEPLNEVARRHLEMTPLHDDILERFYPQAPCWPMPVPREVVEFAGLTEDEQVLAPYPRPLAYAVRMRRQERGLPWTAATVLVDLAAHFLGDAAPTVTGDLQEIARALRREVAAHMDCATHPHAFGVHEGQGLAAYCAVFAPWQGEYG